MPIIILLTLLIGVCNFATHKHFTVWTVNYRKTNEAIASYCIDKYTDANSVYGLDNQVVRGYVNLLFQKSIHEKTSYDSIVEITKDQGKQFAVLISVKEQPKGVEQWNMYEITSIKVIDCINNTESTISIENGTVAEKQHKISSLQ